MHVLLDNLQEKKSGVLLNFTRGVYVLRIYIKSFIYILINSVSPADNLKYQ